jgi:hypothetical protein
MVREMGDKPFELERGAIAEFDVPAIQVIERFDTKDFFWIGIDRARSRIHNSVANHRNILEAILIPGLIR